MMTQLAQDYVFLPQRLIADLQANPVAIGVYALIARLFLIYQAPIPLSAADLQRYDPTLSYGAARGALQRLVALRWLSDQSGHKNCYTPTWGAIKGTPRLWQMDAPTLGRPAHVTTLRLDRRLLDVGMASSFPTRPTQPKPTAATWNSRSSVCAMWVPTRNCLAATAWPRLPRCGAMGSSATGWPSPCHPPPI